MKCILLALGMLCFSVEMNARKASDSEWNDLIWSIAQHESKQNPNARNGQYVGYLQISPTLVNECNKIAGRKKFSNADRLSREKSIEMFNTIQGRYNPQHDMNLAVRIWAAGLVALKNHSAGQRAYREIMVIYNRHRGGK
ncbi:MAG: hypothetical protein ACI3YI_13615 [Bacteroidaceae bacterium]